MNDRSIIHSPEPSGGGHWLDAYMPEGQFGPQSSQPKAKLIDIATIRGILFRQRWLIIGVLVLALVAGVIMTLMSTPIYRASSTVQVQPWGTYIIDGQDLDQGFAGNQIDEYLLTQIEIIKSKKMARSVAERLNLHERPGFLGENIDAARPENMSDEQWRRKKIDMAASRIKGAVTPDIPQKNWIVAISFVSRDPVFAAEAANAYADTYVESDARSTLDENQYAQGYLRDEIANVRERLASAEQAANAYARNTGIIVQPSGGSEEGGSGLTLTSANLSSINTRVANAKAERIEAEQRWRSIENLPASQLPEVQSNPVLQKLVSDRTAKEAELVELRRRYNDDFPQIENILAQLKTLETQIEQTSADIKATVRNEYIVARNQEQALERELATATGATLEEQDKRVQYSALEREAEALRQQLKSLLDRYNQIASAANVKTGAITKIDSASIPGAPVAPSLTRNLLLSLVFGAALAGGLAVLRETLDDRIRSLEQVEDQFGIPLLGHTPLVDQRGILAEVEDSFGALMEAYASIRSTIDFALPRDQNVLQLTSSAAGEGKSTTAVVIAELFASTGRKTLLIDADLRKPSVTKLLEIEKPEHGFVEVLLGHIDLESAVVSGGHENLDILPVGEVPPNPTELLGSSQLRDFIAKYREEYSLILFDSTPVIGLADAPTLARQCDATIFVLEANSVSFGQVKNAIRRLRSGGGRPLGIVLTKYQPLKAGDSYGYQYGYYEYGSGKKAS